jgi:hypothetical protein
MKEKAAGKTASKPSGQRKPPRPSALRPVVSPELLIVAMGVMFLLASVWMVWQAFRPAPPRATAAARPLPNRAADVPSEAPATTPTATPPTEGNKQASPPASRETDGKPTAEPEKPRGTVEASESKKQGAEGKGQDKRDAGATPPASSGPQGPPKEGKSTADNSPSSEKPAEKPAPPKDAPPGDAASRSTTIQPPAPPKKPKAMPRAESVKWLEDNLPDSHAGNGRKGNASVLLRTLDYTPTNPSLILHGLEGANEQIADQGSPLRTTFDGKSEHSMRVTSGKKPLVRFFLATDSIRYQCHVLSDVQVKALGSCVLEVKSDEGPVFVALHEPLQVKTAPTEKGVAKVDIRENNATMGNTAVLDLVAGYTLFLGKGKIRTGGAEAGSYSFAKNDNDTAPRTSHEVPELAKKFAFAGVEIVLAKVEDHTYELRLQPRLSKEDKEARDSRTEDIEETNTSIKDAEADCKELGKLYKTLRNSKLQQLWEAAFSKLNKRFHHDAPPPPQKPAKPEIDPRDKKAAQDAKKRYNADLAEYQAEMEKYRRDHVEPLLKETDAEIKKLQHKIEEYKHKKGKLSSRKEELQKRVAGLLGAAEDVSAVLYRVVDGIRVDTVIIGEP